MLTQISKTMTIINQSCRWNTFWEKGLGEGSRDVRGSYVHYSDICQQRQASWSSSSVNVAATPLYVWKCNYVDGFVFTYSYVLFCLIRRNCVTKQIMQSRMSVESMPIFCSLFVVSLCKNQCVASGAITSIKILYHAHIWHFTQGVTEIRKCHPTS